MSRTIYTTALAAILGLFSLPAFAQSKTVPVENPAGQGGINANDYKDGKLMAEEPLLIPDEAGTKGKTDSKAGEGKRGKGDSIDSGHEGG